MCISKLKREEKFVQKLAFFSYSPPVEKSSWNTADIVARMNLPHTKQ